MSVVIGRVVPSRNAALLSLMVAMKRVGPGGRENTIVDELMLTTKPEWRVKYRTERSLFLVGIECLCTLVVLMDAFLVITSSPSFHGSSHNLWLVFSFVSLCLLCLR